MWIFGRGEGLDLWAEICAQRSDKMRLRTWPDESPLLVIALLGVMASCVGCNGEKMRVQKWKRWRHDNWAQSLQLSSLKNKSIIRYSVQYVDHYQAESDFINSSVRVYVRPSWCNDWMTAGLWFHSQQEQRFVSSLRHLTLVQGPTKPLCNGHWGLFP